MVGNKSLDSNEGFTEFTLESAEFESFVKSVRSDLR